VAESEWCYDTARQVVPIFHHACWAPNVFTPDENGNDAFAIVADGIVEYHLAVFSRSGLLVFETTDPEAAWHGEYRGKKAPQGTYVWIATYTTTEKPRQKETVKGTVTLLR
jgi:gliding motility-associated-like protein